MFKGEPQVGDVFLDMEGDNLLILQVEKDGEPCPNGEINEPWVKMVRVDSTVDDDYYFDSLDNFKCGTYVAKVG